MKVGAEISFLAGQIFMLGVTAVAVLPRVPSDSISPSSRIGGRLSLPFRTALLWLASIGLIRTFFCHCLLAVYHPANETTAASPLLKIGDAILGTIQVVGQNFLCLTTAYILLCQLETIINIQGGSPGRSLMPYLASVFVLTVAGSLLSSFVNPYWFFLVNLAEAISCRPVVKTLKRYASLSTQPLSRNSVIEQQRMHGPILVQVLLVVEYWFLTTALLSCVADFVTIGSGENDWEASTGGISFVVHLLLQAIRANQDNGIDDWMRLLLHSVFLNSIDELEHFTRDSSSSSTRSTTNNSEPSTSDRANNKNDNSNISMMAKTHAPLLGVRQRGF